MPRAILLLALLAGGCVSASEVRHRTTRIGRAVRPALRQMKEDSRRLVRAAGQAADDAALAARVKAVMLTRSGLDARQVCRHQLRSIRSRGSPGTQWE
jgi:urease accessory protein UreF